MVHNIPSAVTPEQLLEMWPMDGSYDFLYAPGASGGGRLAGFAFLNFASAEWAVAFASRWHGVAWPGLGGRRLRLARAHVQGLDANVQHLAAKHSRSNKARRCGLIIVEGSRWAIVEER